jgi:methylenetetrahydrofolate dehydrogenase (NADP+)/methenyltetrahydrofolate cyclohydrolase
MLIDGKKIADQIQNEIRRILNSLPGRKPCLAVIIVGDHAPSKLYVAKKTQACEEIGMHSIVKALPANTSEQEIIAEISKLNNNDAVDGILVQLPLPAHISALKIIHRINPSKDVDGLNPLNVGKLLIGEQDTFIPCTPLGIKVLLERSGIEVEGKHVLVLGRSNLVGKPMAAILMQTGPGGNATVTVANSKTKNLKALSLSAEIIIAAIGSPRFLTADMIKDGAVVIDVGINKVAASDRSSGYELCGDVDFEKVKDKCSFITPVPGGVGPMTIAMLLSNTLKSFLNRNASAQKL